MMHATAAGSGTSTEAVYGWPSTASGRAMTVGVVGAGGTSPGSGLASTTACMPVASVSSCVANASMAACVSGLSEGIARTSVASPTTSASMDAARPLMASTDDFK